MAIVAVVMLVAVGGLSSAFLSSVELGRSNDESAIADQGLQEILATIQATPFADVFATFNNDPDDDPSGVGSAVGKDFDVLGLSPQDDDPDGRVGEILFPSVVVAGVEQLREDFVDDSIGMPRDLNADGGWDNADHSTDYVLLPVTVRVQWTGATGDRFLEFDLLLVE